MQQESKNKIDHLSEQIQIDPLNKSFIIERSDTYVLTGKYDQAISDCSKLILLEPSRQFYVKRSRLLQERGNYSLALQDLADARTLSKDSSEDTAADIYLENSMCMINLKSAAEMAQLVEQGKQKADVTPYTKLLEELLHIQEMKFQQQEKQRKDQIQRIRIHYEKQTQTLKEQFFNRLNELRFKVTETVQNYQEKFLNRLKMEPLLEPQKNKLKLYFQTFSSEAQKYYIAAKNLRQIEDKSLKFEDFQGMIINKGRSEFMKKLYHLFDHFSPQIDKVVALVQNIPYIGCAFNIIKTSMKTKGWVDDANMQNQCNNIERTAMNTTAFNQLMTNLAFFITFHFKKNILAEHPKYKSKWQLLVDRVKQIRRVHLGIGKYKHSLGEEMDVVKDYATVHASIVMVAVACNCLTISTEALKQANVAYQEKQKEIPHLRPIFKVIEEIEDGLRKTDNGETPSKEAEKNEKSYCEIW